MAWETNYDSLAVRVYGTLINLADLAAAAEGGSGSRFANQHLALSGPADDRQFMWETA